MELTTHWGKNYSNVLLFMMSKIQNLNGTHNTDEEFEKKHGVVYDVKDTKFEWNSQQHIVISRTAGGCL